MLWLNLHNPTTSSVAITVDIDTMLDSHVTLAIGFSDTFTGRRTKICICAGWVLITVHFKISYRARSI